MKKKNLAFTLAEVLIVIGIIGVVAALTLPNLNHATGDKEKVTKVKKIYSALTEAVDRAQAIYGPFDTWFDNVEFGSRDESQLFARRVTEFLKISKDCKFNEGCFSSSPLLGYDGSISYNNYLSELVGVNTYMVTLHDGISLGFQPCYIGTYYKIRVDIDGPNKGKNQMGNDIFDFSVLAWDINESGYNNGQQINVLTPSLFPDVHYIGDGYVTGWVIENGNLDYLKCPDELNWETKTSCE